MPEPGEDQLLCCQHTKLVEQLHGLDTWAKQPCIMGIGVHLQSPLALPIVLDSGFNAA
jgi:hypothetical protein